MQFPNSRILIFAKAPIPGLAKTRLIPALGADGAAQLYAEMLQATVQKISTDSLSPLECWCTPDCTHELFQQFDSQFDLSLHTQQGEGLGERMAYATQQALQEAEAVVLIGGDAPCLTIEHLQKTMYWLNSGADAVLGPAEDGGYVLLALRHYKHELFSEMPWGTDQVLSITRQRLKQLGWHWRELPVLWDVDRPEDLDRLT
ncbi:MAG: TIGR04282 family arsenosugar biosynthesis glycosyltransferase [Candidatus Polarisedimenticolaceae bacterium]|nr:TIGR04282 family arsenosugar biosynthesis glycosyltransferase [Candidatus Polarisedimenticolaceae bacterium]